MNNATYTWRNIKNLSVCSCSCNKIIPLSTLKLKNKLVDGWRTTKWSWNGHKHFVFSDLYVICNKCSFFRRYSLRFCSSTKNSCELFKSLRYMYILKIRREGIKRIKTLHSALKNPMTLHFYIAKWNNFFCSLIKSNSLLLFT